LPRRNAPKRARSGGRSAARIARGLFSHSP